MKYKLKVTDDYTITSYGWDKKSAYDAILEKDPFIRFSGKTAEDLERIVNKKAEEFLFKHGFNSL